MASRTWLGKFGGDHLAQYILGLVDAFCSDSPSPLIPRSAPWLLLIRRMRPLHTGSWDGPQVSLGDQTTFVETGSQ